MAVVSLPKKNGGAHAHPVFSTKQSGRFTGMDVDHALSSFKCLPNQKYKCRSLEDKYGITTHQPPLASCTCVYLADQIISSTLFNQYYNINLVLKVFADLEHVWVM
jgi:hypothetical protein